MKRLSSRSSELRMSRMSRMVPKYAKGVLLTMGIGCMAIAVLSVVLQEEDSHSSSRRLLSESGCKGDTFLPLIPGEEKWSDGFRACLYAVFLGWLFLGTAISADVFMSAIEVITSKTKEHVIGEEKVEVEVWNATVANLTLMALGSSAPEILLAVVETVSLSFEAGDLGPGTIVGSAAFNLLFISAICISCLPEKEDDPSMLETRKIEEFGVFVITAIASLWAYLWLVLTLAWISKDVVDLWEALLTFFMFPILVGLAYGQDCGWGRGKDAAKVSPESEHVVSIDGHKQKRHTINEGNGNAHEEATAAAEEEPTESEEVVQEAQQVKKKKKSRLEYRIQATRKMTGGKRVIAPTKKASAAEDGNAEDDIKGVSIAFEQMEYAVPESCGAVKIVVVRKGSLDKACSVQFDTSDCDAKAGQEYVQTSGTIKFEAQQTTHTISIEVIDDNEWAPDKKFFVRLYNAEYGVPEPDSSKPTLAAPTTQVVILNDDDPGQIAFETRTSGAGTVAEAVKLKLLRTDGCSGTVLAFVKTTDGTAIAGTDYSHITEDAEVLFEHEQREAFIDVQLLKSGNSNVSFDVTITSVVPEGASIGEKSMCTVVLSDDARYQKLMDDVLSIMEEENYGVGTSSWTEQVNAAMNMEVDEDSEPGCMDYFMHAISFYWKVMHAAVPPTNYCGGWATFFCSLGCIGFITCLVGDTAKMFGCCVGLDNAITAITFVALGTSLPDTFASMEATINDETADAAITNVTGSNSVNVFLGLGLPWLMATVYHTAQGSTYNYPAGDLVFSVLVFFAFATICLVLLYVRRVYCGGELGGPKKWAYIHSGVLALAWFCYILLSSLKTKKHI